MEPVGLVTETTAVPPPRRAESGLTYIDSSPPSFDVEPLLAISAPHMHAAAVENLEPFLKVGAKVLDIGLFAAFHHW